MIIDTVSQTFVEALFQKDPVTGGHSRRVALWSKKIAEHLIASSKDSESKVRELQELDDIYISALLHDVGKIGVDDRVLKKSDVLTDLEWVEMKKHPDIGALLMDRLLPLGLNQSVLDGVKFHHEKWDGSGYPNGLKQQEIPITARIIAVADAFDAITSKRPYKAAYSEATALDLIFKSSGSQFDPDVVDALSCILGDT